MNAAANPPPRFALAEIERRRDRIYEEVMQQRVGERLQLEQLQTLTNELRRLLPARIAYDTVFESVRHLLGAPLTELEAAATAWRLAGNVPKLRAGEPASPWTRQNCNEWVPLQILRVDAHKSPRGKHGAMLRCRALAGSPCPSTLTAFWTHSLTKAMAIRLGFSRPWGRYPYRGQLDLVGLRFLGELDRLRSQHAPVFYEVTVPPVLTSWNREHVLKVRCRVDPCPRGYIHQCAACAVGYVNCPAGTHRLDFIKQFCPICGDDAWFDPEIARDRCRDCHNKERLRA